MSEQVFGVLLTALGVVFVAIIAQAGSIIVKRMKPALSQPEMWERVDKLTAVIYGDGKSEPGLLERVSDAEDRADATSRKNDALGRIIRDLAGQWSGPRPKLNPGDLAELDEKYIPATHPWRQKPPSTNNTRTKER